MCFKLVQPDPAADFKDEKRREKKGDSLYQEMVMIALLAAAGTELRGAKSDVEVTKLNWKGGS